jgi:hypothetical protein
MTAQTSAASLQTTDRDPEYWLDYAVKMRAIGIKKLRLDSFGNVEIEVGDPEVTVQVPFNPGALATEAERKRNFEETLFYSAGGVPPDDEHQTFDDGN